jgi:hypothetical protein
MLVLVASGPAAAAWQRQLDAVARTASGPLPAGVHPAVVDFAARLAALDAQMQARLAFIAAHAPAPPTRVEVASECVFPTPSRYLSPFLLVCVFVCLFVCSVSMQKLDASADPMLEWVAERRLMYLEAARMRPDVAVDFSACVTPAPAAVLEAEYARERQRILADAAAFAAQEQQQQMQQVQQVRQVQQQRPAPPPPLPQRSASSMALSSRVPAQQASGPPRAARRSMTAVRSPFSMKLAIALHTN